MLNFECKIENKSGISRELTISVKPESIQKYMEEGLKSAQKTAKIKGFRQGKVPLNIVKQYFLSDVKNDVFSKVVRDSYIQALEENKIYAIGNPQIQAKSGLMMLEGEPLTFTATIEVYPEIKVTDLSKVKIEGTSAEVSAADLEKNMDQLRDSHSQMVPDVDHKGAAKNGDYAEISFKGTVNGKSLDSLNGDNRLIHIGSKQYMEEFENGVVGMKVGEEKTFSVPFPKEFPESSLAGQTVEFVVTLHEFKKKQLPSLDDEFAKQFKLETMDDLKKKIKETLEQDRQKEAKDKLRENLFTALTEAHEFDVPNALLTSQLDYLINEESEYLKRNGFTAKMIQDYFSKNKDVLKKRAEGQVKVALVLDKISQDQNIKVEDKDLDVEFAKMGASFNVPAEQVREMYGQDESAMRQLRYRMKEEQTIDYVLGQVKISNKK